MPATAIAAPQPIQGETREDYTVRAHRQLMAIVPEPSERNQIVWDAWDASFGDIDRDRSETIFPPELFEQRRNVCLWHEHETVSRDPHTGEDIVKRNDIERIKSIVRENNMRIADTDAYSAIVDKHTLPSGKRDPIPPRTIGFVGPFRIGMIGRVTPKFALFGDEHRRRDEAHTFRDRPRRSVEVLTLRANGRSYIDPVAALSEAPRLPLPVQYGAEADPEGIRERYEAVAAFPGGNTFIPGRIDRENYTTEAMSGPDGPKSTPKPQAKTMALQPEDITQIIDAMMSTPHMQFVGQLMQMQGMEQAGGGMGEGMGSPVGAGGAPGGTHPPPAQPPATGVPVPAMPGGLSQADGAGPGIGQPGVPAGPDKDPFGAKYGAAGMMPGAGMASQYMTNRFGAAESNLESEEEMRPEQYAAIIERLEQHEELAERYSALEADHQSLMQEHTALRRGFAEVRMREADATRRAAIGDLANQFPHFVERDREESKCLYSAGSEMTDEQFSEHLAELEHYAAKAPVASGMVPSGVFPERNRSVETERYEASVAAKAVEIYTQTLHSGRRMTYAEASKAAREVLS